MSRHPGSRGPSATHPDPLLQPRRCWSLLEACCSATAMTGQQDGRRADSCWIMMPTFTFGMRRIQVISGWIRGVARDQAREAAGEVER